MKRVKVFVRDVSYPVTVARRTERVPEMWLVGMSQRGYSPREAMTYWAEQMRMENRFKRQRATRRAKHRAAALKGWQTRRRTK